MRNARRYPIAGVAQPMSEADDIRQRNQAAANAWQARVHAIADGDPEDSAEPARIALAKALGEDPNTPSGPLMARFRSLPPSVQAGIYKRGGAQFIGGQEGSKMISSLAQDKEKHLDSLTSQMAEHLASGKIDYDTDGDGKPAFFELVDDPSDPLKQKKIKQPLNLLRQQILQRGLEKGTIPNPFVPAQAPAPLMDLDPTKTGKMSAEAFQQILDARASGMATGPTPKRPTEAPGVPVGPAITQAPTAMNPGWLADGGPQRLVNNVQDTTGSVIDTVKNMMGGIGNVMTAPYRGAANFLLGDKIKPVTDAITYSPTYQGPAPVQRPAYDPELQALLPAYDASGY